MHEGMPIVEAALEGAKLRFRPILMTAFAFILGVVPLVTASGAGAEGRKVMGMAVFRHADRHHGRRGAHPGACFVEKISGGGKHAPAGARIRTPRAPPTTAAAGGH
jgi:hypothetical protein